MTNTTATAMLSDEQNREHQGIFAMIMAKRLLEILEDNDTCSDFRVYYAPLIAILLLACVVAGALYAKKKYDRTHSW